MSPENISILYERLADIILRMTNRYEKQRALCEIALGMHQFNSKKSIALFRQALSVGDEIESKENNIHGKRHVYSQIAAMAFPVDEVFAFDILDQITSIKWKDEALQYFYRTAVSKKDIKHAVKISKLISQPKYQPFFQEIVQEDVDWALGIVEAMNDDKWKGYALTNIAESFIGIDNQRALDLYKRAVDFTVRITRLSERDQRLSSIADRLGYRDTTLAIQILNYIESLFRDTFRMDASFYFIPKLVIQDIDQALIYLEKIYWDSEKIRTIVDIIIELQKNNLSSTESICEKLLKFVHEKITDVDSIPYSLANIAAGIYPTNPERAQEIFEQSLQAADQIESEEDKWQNYAQIACAAFPVSDKIAFDIWDRTQSDEWKYSILCEICPLIAETDINRALEFAEMLTTETERVAVLICILTSPAIIPRDKFLETHLTQFRFGTLILLP
jgi:tetratricopeptide (TPR) repeat protein